jgi:hypothetical protein
MKLSTIAILALYSTHTHAEYKSSSCNWNLNILPKQENKRAINLLSIFTKEDVYIEIKSGNTLINQLATGGDHSIFKYQDVDIFGFTPKSRHDSLWPSDYNE